MYTWLTILILSAPFIFGSYYEWSSCIAAVCLCAALFMCFRRNGRLIVRSRLLLAASGSIVAVMLISPLWAVDKGMAPIGAVKFLPLPLFVLAADQLSEEEREKILFKLPLAGVSMTLVSASGYILRLISSFPPAAELADFFLNNDRLSGFFGYPNAFALFLLICVIALQKMIGSKKEDRSGNLKLLPGEVIGLAVLSAGIILSGSRTVLILAGLFAVINMFTLKRKVRVVLLCVTGAAVAGIAALLFFRPGSQGRFLTYSLSPETFYGRLLYYRDALPVILKHPAGLGYMGYFETQGSFQTGVYTVMHVHNDLLQIFLDAGWLPGILCAVSLVRMLTGGKKKKEAVHSMPLRMIVSAIVLHSLLDFDLQFIAIDFILLLCMTGSSTEKELHVPKAAVYGLLPAAALIGLYFMIPTALYNAGIPSAAARVYPAYTLALEKLLIQAETEEEMELYADRILRLNPDFSLANSAKARLAYGQGDFDAMVRYKERAIRFSRYTPEEYEDYYEMLYRGYELYRQAGDEESAEYCLKKMQKISEMMEEVKEGTSFFGWRIKDKPEI